MENPDLRKKYKQVVWKDEMFHLTNINSEVQAVEYILPLSLWLLNFATKQKEALAL